MYLVVDCGNSAIKLYVFTNNELLYTHRFVIHEIDACIAHIEGMKSVTKAIFCSVSDNMNLLKQIQSIMPCMEFSISTPIPLVNAYESKQSMGLDRLAAAVGAEYLAPACNKLIFDFGTAITIDFVSDKHIYIGGNISPGLHTRSKALQQHTELLPYVSDFSDISLTGKNTRQAIQNGVVLGILYEIEGYIAAYNTKYENISLFFTGGDAIFFEKMVKKPIFAEPNLIAFGLYRILQNNADN
ncbi:MAG TPA: type III pantothenate kinase [Bacteroidales bacterium]|nr:type III pantothenate kinase [Bacteroidales bacterium]HPM12204.1 type III pantothenate kinase [Bacteroidales bacterium]